MRRRKFIQSVSSAAALSVVPINTIAGSHSFKEVELATFLPHTDRGSVQIEKLQSQTTTVKCKGDVVKIHAIQTGSVAVKRSHKSKPTAHFLTPFKISLDKHFTQLMPIWVWIIEHPEGVLVIDTGENANISNPEYFASAGRLVNSYSQRNFKFQVQKENEVGYQLKKLGISNDRVKNVVLTHLHIDHTDGIKDFKNVEILVNAEEFKKPNGHFPELVPNWFKPKTVHFKKDRVAIFDYAYPITENEDVLLIPTPGHTQHHASVLFKTDDFDILFAGDVCYNQEQLIKNELPGINANYKKSRETYKSIKQYAFERNVVFMPSHDTDSFERLKSRLYL